MASVQEALFAQLAAAVAGRVYPLVAPDGAAMPYLVYQRVANTVANVLAGNGSPPIDNSRIQIDVWAASYASAQATARTAKDLLLAWSVQNVLVQELDQYEPQTKRYRVILDYSVWSANG